MNAGRLERRKEETHQKIINVAMDLFRKQGFDTTTMEQIAEESDIVKKTLYNHFPVKEAIVNAYIQREVRENRFWTCKFVEGLPNTRSRLVSVLLIQWKWAKANLPKDMLKKLYIFGMQNILELISDPGLRSGFDEILAYIIRLGQDAGEVRQDVPAEELAGYLDWIQASTMMRWIVDPENYQIQEGINRSVDLFLDGARSKRGDKR